MEVTIEDTQGIENDALISIRAGSTRRQAPINVKQAFSFPSLPLNANPFKIDVLRPVCSQRVRINASLPQAEEAYEVLFPSKDGATVSMRLKVKESPQMCGTQNARGAGDAAPSQEADGLPAIDMDLNRKAERTAAARSAAEAYLERFKLLKFVQEMLQYIIREKPEDPYCWMSDYLRKFDSKAPQGQSAAKPQDQGFQTVRKDAKDHLIGASLDGRLDAVFKKLNPPKEKPKRVPATPPANTVLAWNCSCGNAFMDDSIFCRKCGAKRERIEWVRKPFPMNPSVGTWMTKRSFRAERNDEKVETASPRPAEPDFRRTPQCVWDSHYANFNPAPGSPQHRALLKKNTQPSNPDFRRAPEDVFAGIHSQFNPAPGSPQAKRAEPTSAPPAEADKAAEPEFQSRELPFELLAAAPQAAPEAVQKPVTPPAEDQVVKWMSRQNDRLDEENERIRQEILQLHKFIQDKGVALSPAAAESLAALRTTGILEGVMRQEHDELAGKNRQLRSEHEALRNTLSEFCLGLSDLAKGLANSVATVAPTQGVNGQQAPVAPFEEDAVVAENARLEAENKALMAEIQALEA